MPSDIGVSKMPGLAIWTGTFTVAVPPAAFTVTGTLLPGLTSQGTCTVTDSCTAPVETTLETRRIGAERLLNVTLSGPSVSGSPPNRLTGSTEPCTPGATPAPVIVTRLHGDMEPPARPAALKKLLALKVGPIGIAVSKNVAIFPWALAVTVTLPVVAPAVRVTWALPEPSVFTVADVWPPMEAGPLTVKATGKFPTVPALEFTCTTSGCAKLLPKIAVWESPESFWRMMTVTGFTTLIVKVAVMLPAIAALTVTWPDAEFESVTVVEAKPCALEEPLEGLTVAAPAGETVQVTAAPEIGVVPVESATRTTSGLASVWPGTPLCPPPLETLREPAAGAVVINGITKNSRKAGGKVVESKK